MEKIKDILKMSSDTYDSLMKKINGLAQGTVFTNKDEREIRGSIYALNYTLKRASMGHIVPPQFKNYVRDFEKHNFDINKIDPKVRNSLAKTYLDFQEVNKHDPKTFTESPANLYCAIYNALCVGKVSQLYARLKKSKYFNKNKFTMEAFNGIDEMCGYLSVEGHNIYSTELLEKTVIGVGVQKLTAIGSGLNIGLTIIAICLLVLTIATIALCVINMNYTIELSKVLERTLNEDVANSGSAESQKRHITTAVQNMTANTNPMTKATIYKASEFGLQMFDKLTSNYRMVDDTLKQLDKSTEEFKLTADMSREDAVDQVNTFASNSRGLFETILWIAIIVGMIKVGIALIRASVYWIKNFKIDVSNFFNNQADIIQVNIEELTAKINDPSTTEMERERLKKIIQKQQGWCKNLANVGAMFYKSQHDAARQMQTEVEKEDRIDFEKEAAIEDEVKQAEYETPVAENPVPPEEPDGGVEIEEPTNNTGPAVIF